MKFEILNFEIQILKFEISKFLNAELFEQNEKYKMNDLTSLEKFISIIDK